MKRVGFILFGAVVAAMLTASVGLGVSRSGVALNIKAAQADMSGSAGAVCVAVPIFAGNPGPNCKAGQVEIENDPANGGAIVSYLKLILKLLNGLIGGIIMLMLVVAGIQYITSAADPARVKAAKERITNAITALVLYMMMFAILNFLVPGGIL